LACLSGPGIDIRIVNFSLGFNQKKSITSNGKWLMEYDLDKEDKGLAKGPFYGAAAFIFIVISLFASISLQEHGTLSHWQIAACLLGTGLIAILLFLPYFLRGILDQIEELLNKNDSDSIGKAIFELQEIRSELNALSLKTDKVPTLVDKIVSESIQKSSEDLSESETISKLSELESKIFQKLNEIDESNLSSPLLPEPEQNNNGHKEALEKLSERVESLQKSFDSFKKDSSISSGSDIAFKDKQELANEPEATEAEEIKPQDSIKDEPEVVAENEKDSSDDQSTDTPEYDLEEINDLSEDEEQEEPLEETEDIVEENEIVETTSPSIENTVIEESDDLDSYESTETKAPEITEEELPQELDLGLPSPEETLRKVDALLSGDEKVMTSQNAEDKSKTGEKNGTTTVVANVMIGIGNKPYVRGEGPGLSWDEGVSMNFIEIGKWAWSPPRKNASLTVQIYRNDQDPDKGGKVNVEPGQKLEITPDFS
jgi:chemotaxis protein histidine kinase CheA